jgi:hypothetical protein
MFVYRSFRALLFVVPIESLFFFVSVKHFIRFWRILTSFETQMLWSKCKTTPCCHTLSHSCCYINQLRIVSKFTVLMDFDMEHIVFHLIFHLEECPEGIFWHATTPVELRFHDPQLLGITTRSVVICFFKMFGPFEGQLKHNGYCWKVR